MPSAPDGRPDLAADAKVMRYVSGGQLQDDIVDGSAFKKIVDGAAFKTRPSDDGELSVNECGIFSEDFETDLSEIRRIRSQWMTIRKTGRFAELSISDIEKCAAEAGTSFGYWSTPVSAEAEGREGCDDDPSHAVIYGIPANDDDTAVALRDMIAMKVLDLHPGAI